MERIIRDTISGRETTERRNLAQELINMLENLPAGTVLTKWNQRWEIKFADGRSEYGLNDPEGGIGGLYGLADPRTPEVDDD